MYAHLIQTQSLHLSHLKLLESSSINTCLHPLQVIDSDSSACLFVRGLLSAFAFSPFFQPFAFSLFDDSFCTASLVLFSEFLFNKSYRLLICQYVFVSFSSVFSILLF